MAKPGEQAQVRAIDKVRGAFMKRRREVHVKEWDLTLFFGPLTTADVDAVEERMESVEGLDPAKRRSEKNLLLLIHKAQNEDGSRAFEFGDKHWLATEADYVVIQRLIGEMYAGAITLEEARGKSEATEASASA